MRDFTRKRLLFLVAAILMAVFLSAAAFDFSWFESEDVSKPIQFEDVRELHLSEHLDEFGVHAEGLERINGYFNHRESVYTLLESQGMSRIEIHEVAQELKTAFDPKKIYPSQRYFFYKNPNDTTGHAIVSMVIEKNEQDFVRVDLLEQDIHIIEGSRVVEAKEIVIEGVIERSLYHTLVDQKLPYDLLWKLEQVYDWKVDFNRLQPGDSFRLAIEELWIGDRMIGFGDILASEFIHKQNKLVAFRYKKDGRSIYYDEQGKSLNKAILKAPLKYTRVSSGFSNNRLHPVLKRRMPHHGIDFAAPAGTPVVSAGDGVVEFAGYKGANGNYIRIRHNNTYQTAYLHLRNFAKGIKPGTKVKQGQIIGYVGSTGRSTGPHLDYRVFKDGIAVNPFTLELPATDKLDNQEYAHFAATTLGLYSDFL